MIDGAVYIKDDDAVAFFRNSAAPTHAAETLKKTISKRRADIVEAREILAATGFNYPIRGNLENCSYNSYN